MALPGRKHGFGNIPLGTTFTIADCPIGLVPSISVRPIAGFWRKYCALFFGILFLIHSAKISWGSRPFSSHAEQRSRCCSELGPSADFTPFVFSRLNWSSRDRADWTNNHLIGHKSLNVDSATQCHRSEYILWSLRHKASWLKISLRSTLQIC